MTAAANNFARLADDLGLVAEKTGLFIGKIRGLPVGVKCIDPEGSGLLLFQIRHPMPPGAKELSNIQNASEIERLVAEKKIEISLEDKAAWLTFVEGAKLRSSPVGTGNGWISPGDKTFGGSSICDAGRRYGKTGKTETEFVNQCPALTRSSACKHERR